MFGGIVKGEIYRMSTSEQELDKAQGEECIGQG